MTKLKCPYCNKQIQHAITIDGHDFYWCENYDCDSSSEMVGTEEMWATVIDTKKKLDVYKKAYEVAEISLTAIHLGNCLSAKNKAANTLDATCKILEQIKDNDKDVK